MRLVATDLDGTVVRPDGTLSPRTLAAFERCRRGGVQVVFVTGRPPRWMPPVAAATGHTGLAICGNGAVVYDLGSDAVLEVRPLAGPEVRRTVTALRAALGEVVFAFETPTGPLWQHGYASRSALAGADEGVRGELDELLGGDPIVLKVLCRSRIHRADAMLAVARRVLAGFAEPVHSNPDDAMLEISAVGVSKASALERLTAGLGIAAQDVVAFGDMPNDVAMLRWAGRGYAMADGHPEAVAAANEVAPPCAEDGVAQVLEGLLGVSGSR